MGKRVGLVFMFFTCLLLTFVLDQRISYAPTSTEIIKNQRDGSQQSHITLDQVQNFYFGQEDETGIYKIVEFNRSQFPQRPSVFALHEDNAYVLLQVATTNRLEQVEEIFSEIRIEGNVGYSTTVSELEPNKFELRINLQKINNGFAINFGNLPAITFKKMAPLRVKVEQDPERGALLLNNESQGKSFLYITNKQEAVTLRFSEPMVDRESIGPAWLDGLSGRWLDEQTYRLSVGTSRDKPINLRNLYSFYGNYLPSSFEDLEIRRVPEREWIDYDTRQQVGGDKFGSYYDQIIYSPSKEKYVGLINLGDSEGDSGENYYAFVLEEPGKEPIIVENVFLSIQRQADIQWVDNDRLLYAAYYGVFLYDSNTKTKKELFHNHFDKAQGSIMEAAYDTYKKKLFLLVSFHAKRNEESYYYVEKWEYDYLVSAPSYKFQFSPTFLAYKYQLKQLPIHIDDTEIYWTFVQPQNKQVMTLKQHRDGSKTAVAGEVVTIDGKGNSYLLRNRDADGKKTDDRYYYWEIGKKPRLIAKRSGRIVPFGASLVAMDKERCYQYDPVTREWLEVQLYGRDLHIPSQDQSAYYRRLKHAGRPLNL